MFVCFFVRLSVVLFICLFDLVHVCVPAGIFFLCIVCFLGRVPVVADRAFFFLTFLSIYRNATSLAAVVEIANSKARAGLVMIARSARAWAGVVPVGGQAEVRPIIPCPLVLLLQ